MGMLQPGVRGIRAPAAMSYPLLVNKNQKPPSPHALCPLSLLDGPSFSWSGECPKVVPKGYLPGCGPSSLWAISGLRSLELG